MTLIAGFKINHVPVLIGDFLLNSSGPSYVKNELGRSVFKNAIRKTVKLADNCVLAWSGSLLAAEPIYKDLYAHFRSCGRPFTKATLEDFLTTQYVHEETTQLHAVFIGWIFDEEPSCFLWRTDYPKEVFYGDYKTEGTGTKYIDAFITNSETIEKWSERGQTLAENMQYLLHCLSYLMQLETDEAVDIERKFGMAYEALYFNGRSFEYLTDVNYCSARVFLDEDGTFLHHEFIEPIFQYMGTSSFAVIVRMWPSTRERHWDLILPPGFELHEYKSLRHALFRMAIDVRLWDDPIYGEEGRTIGHHSVVYLNFVKKDERVYPMILPHYVCAANDRGDRLAVCKRDGDLFVMHINLPQGAIDYALRNSRLRDGRLA